MFAPLAEGYKRQWLRCRTCDAIQYYDYVPFSLSNPIASTVCKHGIGEKDLGCDRISETQALQFIEERKRKK